MTLHRPHRVRYLIQLAFLAVLAACGSSAVIDETRIDEGAVDAAIEVETTTTTPATSEPAPDPDVVEELPGATEEENTAALIEEIEEVFLAWQERGGMPAVSLSIRLPDREPINLANGVTDLISETPVTTEDVFRIGSITKPMTSAIVLQLVDEGLIELDEPVQTYLPGWLDGHQYASEITIRQLMNHTNGLVEYAQDPGFFAASGTRLDQPFTPEEIVEWLAQQEPLFAPGEQYQYETGGFLSLGSVIETVTGNTAAQEMRTRIFEPSGANNITLAPQETSEGTVVHGYGRGLFYLAGTSILGRVDEAGLTINDEPVVDYLEIPQAALASAGWTGGGNEAQLESVSAIMGALFDGTILTDDQIAEMTAPTLGESYGLGIDDRTIDGTRVISHGGGVPGFRSYGAYLPEHDVSWAMSTTLIPLPDDAALGDFVAEMTPLLAEAAG